MSIFVDEAVSRQYTSNLTHLAQQGNSVFEGAVTRGNYVGEQGVVVEQLGEVEAQSRGARHEDLKQISVPHERPWVFPEEAYLLDYIDSADKVQMLINAENGYAEAFMKALRRKKDDQIIEAFFGSSVRGKQGTTSVPLPAAQTIAHGGANLTVARLTKAKKILLKAEVNEDEEFHVAIGAEQWEPFIQEASVAGFDTNNTKPLVDAQVSFFMGCFFHHSQRLPVTAATGGVRSVPVWVKSGMHLGIWDDIETRIDFNPNKGNQQVYSRQMVGATRTEEVKVVEIECQEP